MSPSISLFLGFLHTKFGFVTAILLPLLLIIFLLTRDFKRGVEEYLGDGDKNGVEGQTFVAGLMYGSEGNSVETLNTNETVNTFVTGLKHDSGEYFVEQGKTSVEGQTFVAGSSPIEMSDEAFNLWMAQHPEMMMNIEYFNRWVALNPELASQWKNQNQ